MSYGGKNSRFLLLSVIFAIHCGIILGPLGINFILASRAEKKEIPFRVKLGGFEPSHAPEAGMPERKRPSPAPATPAPEKPTPPEKKTPPAAKPKPKPKPKKKTVVKPKPKPKPKKKKVVKPKRKVTPKRRVTPEKRSWQKPKPKPKTPEVYRDTRWDNFDPSKSFTPAASGGKNFNRNVPLGSRDRGQKIGPADHRTPAGGATADEEKYWSDLDKFLTEKWIRPPGVLVTQETAVTIELAVGADGRVLRKRIVKRSPNPAVNSSAEAMLQNLSIIPRPPRGAVTFQIKLISE